MFSRERSANVEANSFQVQSHFSLESYSGYVAYENRARYPDLLVMGGLYERAIAEAAKRKFAGEAGAEEALRSFWVGYCDAVVCKSHWHFLSSLIVH